MMTTFLSDTMSMTSITTSLVFDIETRPLPLPFLEENGLLPEITAPGNYKDPDKIAAYIAEKKLEAIDGCALSAITGEVCAIGMNRNGNTFTLMALGQVTEADLLKTFWHEATQTLRSGKLIGFNIKSFDLPFLLRRSWVHGIAHPAIFVDRYFLGTAVWDLRETWQLGDRQAPGNLDKVCRVLGLGAKNGDGANFWKLLRDDPKKAEGYLVNDMKLTVALAERLKSV